MCEPTLALELPRLQLGPTAVDVLTLLARVLDAAAALEHPDLQVLGALTGQYLATQQAHTTVASAAQRTKTWLPGISACFL